MKTYNSLPIKALNYIHRFMLSNGLIPASRSVIVAVSGGRDSMFLLKVCSDLKAAGVLSDVLALNINHGTRPESTAEAEMIAEFARDLKVKFKCISISLSLDLSNFESEARLKRYDIFHQMLGQGQFLYTGHHLDDSFEWSMMQMFKSSDPRSSVGIPVFNRLVARPLLCLARDQISYLVQQNHLPYRDDISNQNLKFERNALRAEITPFLKKKYAGHLKHYIRRSELIVQQFNLTLRQQHLAPKGKFNQIIDHFGTAYINMAYNHNFKLLALRLRTSITNVSLKQRGVLSQQIENLMQMERSGVKGPLLFSGQVYGLTLSHVLYVISQQKMQELALWDERLASYIAHGEFDLQSMTRSKVCNISLKYLEQQLCFPFFPYIVVGKSDHAGKKLPFSVMKKAHPLFPKSYVAISSKGLWCQYLLKLMSDTSGKKINFSEIKVISFRGVTE